MLCMGHEGPVFTADKIVSAFNEMRKPFAFPTNNRPGGAVLREFDDFELPILLLEVHCSHLYKHLVSKMAVNLISQFRLLRNFSPNHQECAGFVFPKYGTKSTVTRVSVCFENFRFVIRLTPVSIDLVMRQVQLAVKNALEFRGTDPPNGLYFVRFSDEELKTAGMRLGLEVTQCPTPHSIILRSIDKYYFKVHSTFERI